MQELNDREGESEVQVIKPQSCMRRVFAKENPSQRSLALSLTLYLHLGSKNKVSSNPQVLIFELTKPDCVNALNTFRS